MVWYGMVNAITDESLELHLNLYVDTL